MRRIGVMVVLAIGFGLAGAQGASATTFTANCSTLENYLDGTNTVNSGDVVKLNAICVNQSFEITNTNAFTLEGVGQTNGTPSSGFTGINNGSGDAILDSGSAVRLTIKNLKFENATRSSGGGTAIDFTDSDNIAVTITGNTFANLSAPGNGGAIQIADSTDGAGSTTPTVISHNVFTGNSSPDGGAIYWANGGPLKLLDNTFTGNTQDSTSTFYPVGGAVDLENYEGTTGVSSTWLGSPVTVSGNTFGGSASGAGNSALAAGGGLFISLQGGEGTGEPAQTVTLTNNQFIDNQVTGGVDDDLYGGALGMSPQVRERAFKVIQTDNLFQGNHITAALNSGYGAGGGAEWGIGLPIKSTRDRFFKNLVNVTGATAVPPLGGAVGILSTNQYIGSASSTTLLHASFTGTDDLFRGNSDPSTDGWGGAIYTGGTTSVNCPTEKSCPSTLTLYDSTLVHNKVPVANGGQGAAIWGGPADSLRLENSIVYGNKGPSGAPEIFGYSKPKYAYDDACTAPGGAPLTGKGDICANPKLVPPGRESKKSPTIDKGSNALVPKGLRTDVVGNHRITEGSPRTCKRIVDMGAFEFRAVKPGRICHPVPVNTKPPHITGTPKVGHRLACVTGSWTNHPTRYRYQWKRNGPKIPGATGSTYRVTAADKGHGLKCTVWAINKNGTSKAAVSAAVHVK
jgi:hypothetical protein